MQDKKDIIENFMQEAVKEALAGTQRVSPNPRTGALIVQNGKIIARGRHEYYGGAHAELNAIRNAGQDLQDAQMFVTLEPCCFYGKTPPCTEAILRSGIQEVYVGILDPNPKVAGKGIEILEKAGLRVHKNILQEKCESINQPYIKMMTKGMPYICAKAAMTLDAFTADSQGNSKWISGPESRREVHRMRAEYDAVMVGMGTVIADDPELTVRDAQGQNPLRIVYDPRGSLSTDSKLVQTRALADLCVICDESSDKEWQEEMEKRDLRLIKIKGKGASALLEGLKDLGRQGIQSVFVEGGSNLHGMLAAQDAIDRLELFIAPRILGEGLPLMKFPRRLMPDTLNFYLFDWKRSGKDMHFSGLLRHYTGDK